jgi:hypothetical protein
MSSGEAAAMCLQSAAAIGDRCGDSRGLGSVFDLFGHGEALQLGIETQWNTFDSSQVASAQPVFDHVRFHMRNICTG